MVDSPPALAATSGGKGELQRRFRALFDTHYGFVRRSLLAFGVAPSLADDASQEVFVVVYRRLVEFDPQAGSMRAWLYGIARRVAQTVMRGEYRAQRKKLALAQVPRVSTDPDEDLARREAAELVREFLATLDPKQREVFMLLQIEGLSAPEVAEALGVKLNTVYSRLRLARRRFDQFVANEAARRNT